MNTSISPRISSGSCSLANLSEEIRVPTLSGIAHRNVLTATLSLELSVDSKIGFASDFILEKGVQEVYRLPSPEVTAKQIEARPMIHPPRHRA